MEIKFQNKQEDFRAFYEYMVKETEEGKKLSFQALRARQIWTILVSALLGALVWGVSGQWKSGLFVTIFFILLEEALIFIIAGFKPRTHEGIQVYKRQEKLITPKELQTFQLPRTLIADDSWLEIRSSEAVHRWRWRQVEKIGVASEFIFIHVGNCPIVYVPKRDFSTEQSFDEFGKKLIELKEKFKDQPIATELPA